MISEWIINEVKWNKNKNNFSCFFTTAHTYHVQPRKKPQGYARCLDAMTLTFSKTRRNVIESFQSRPFINFSKTWNKVEFHIGWDFDFKLEIAIGAIVPPSAAHLILSDKFSSLKVLWLSLSFFCIFCISFDFFFCSPTYERKWRAVFAVVAW